MPGTIVTFYSFKGGVGRSFALANVASILAQWGSRVLAVDWDIEAPGLSHYFTPFSKQKSDGVIEFLADCASGKSRNWSAYATNVEIPDQRGVLHLMPAAADNTDYATVVQRLDWEDLYREKSLGDRLEALRAEWLESFDVVLIDSRTGVTDFSGITTVQLPDVLAFMFTANKQSLEGCADIARRATEARRRMPIDRPALIPLPIPARFEQREEYDRAQEWRKRFSTTLAPFFEVWAPPGSDPIKLVDLLTIPYVPRWTFGEELACLLEPAGSTGTRAPSHAASYACETLAALLIQRFARTDLLISSRDEYVHAARSVAASRRESQREGVRVFISYASSDRDAQVTAKSIATFLEEELGARPFLAAEENVGEQFSARTRVELEEADAAVVLFSKSPDQRQALETETFLRQSLRTQQDRPVIPVVLKDGEQSYITSRLSVYQAVFLNSSPASESELRAHLTPIFGHLRLPSKPSLGASIAENEAVKETQQNTDSAKLAVAYGNQALTLQGAGKLDEALSLLKRQEAIWSELENKEGLIASYGNQALILQSSGRLDEALALLKKQEAISLELGNKDQLQRSYGNQALILKAWGRLDEALALHKKAESIALELGNKQTLQASYGNQALILQDWGRLDEALALLKKQEAICLELGNKDGLQRSYGNQALILQAWGRLDEALALHKKEEAICLELGNKDGLQASYGNQALILKAWGRLDEALALLKKEEAICLELGNKDGLQRSYGNQANILIQQKKLTDALVLLRKQEAICIELGNKNNLGYCYWIWADLEAAQGDGAAQTQKLQHALALFTELNMPRQRDAVQAALDQLPSAD